jgi:hypothetical protein
MRKTGKKAIVRREGAGIFASAKEYSGERIAAVRFQNQRPHSRDGRDVNFVYTNSFNPDSYTHHNIVYQT